MNLSVGIVGLPNVGKSTLFNALLKKQASLVAKLSVQDNIILIIAYRKPPIQSGDECKKRLHTSER